MHIATVPGSDSLAKQFRDMGHAPPSEKAQALHSKLLETKDPKRRIALERALDQELGERKQETLERMLFLFKETQNAILVACLRELAMYEKIVSEVGLERATGDRNANAALSSIHRKLTMSRGLRKTLQKEIAKDPDIIKKLRATPLVGHAQQVLTKVNKALTAIRKRKESTLDLLGFKRPPSHSKSKDTKELTETLLLSVLTERLVEREREYEERYAVRGPRTFQDADQ